MKMRRAHTVTLGVEFREESCGGKLLLTACLDSEAPRALIKHSFGCVWETVS